METRERSLAMGAFTVTLVLWASAFVAIRHLGGSVSPGALSLGRLVIAAVVLGAMVLAVRRPRRWPTRRDLPLLVACGVLWFGFYNIALNAAEQLIDAGTAAMLVQIGPIIVALLAAVFLGEPLTRWLVAGALVGFAGSQSSGSPVPDTPRATSAGCSSRSSPPCSTAPGSSPRSPSSHGFRRWR